MKDIHTFVILAYKENDNLEDCIKSIMKQSVKSNVIIATSTENNYIKDVASKYGLGLMVNHEPSNKARDYNFAIDTFNTELITIAHQDDFYDRNYTKEVIKEYKNNNKDASIFFTDIYELDNDKIIRKSKDLFRRRFKLWPLKFKRFQSNKYFKLRTLKKEKYFCTSSVTFVKRNISNNFFPENFSSYTDWMGFLNLANSDSKFVFIDKQLVGYRLIPKKKTKKMINEEKEILYNSYKKEYVDKYIKRKYRD